MANSTDPLEAFGSDISSVDGRRWATIAPVSRRPRVIANRPRGVCSFSSTGSCCWASTSACCATSTLAACHADQCPETNAHSDSADTYATLVSNPSMIETGIIATHKIVIHPLTRRMNTGSPCTDAHNDLIAVTAHRVPASTFGKPDFLVLKAADASVIGQPVPRALQRVRGVTDGHLMRPASDAPTALRTTRTARRADELLDDDHDVVSGCLWTEQSDQVFGDAVDRVSVQFRGCGGEAVESDVE